MVQGIDGEQFAVACYADHEPRTHLQQPRGEGECVALGTVFGLRPACQPDGGAERCGPGMDARRAAIVARYGNQVAELRDIDAEENARKLRDEAGQKRALVAPVKAKTQALEEAVTRALAAKREAADSAEDSRQNLDNAKWAVGRAKGGSARKRTKRLTDVQMARQVLEEDEANLAKAEAAHEQAKRDREQNKVQIDVLEAAADEAEHAADNPPGRVPPGEWTCLLANPLHLLWQPDLDMHGRLLVAAQIAMLARKAGVADEFRAEGRAQLEAEPADKTRHPVQLQALGNGKLAVTPNMLHPGTPQQFHQPGPGAGQGFTAPLIPGLGS